MNNVIVDPLLILFLFAPPILLILPISGIWIWREISRTKELKRIKESLDRIESLASNNSNELRSFRFALGEHLEEQDKEITKTKNKLHLFAKDWRRHVKMVENE